VRRFPELPLGDVRAARVVLRPEGALLLRGEVLHDRAALPEAQVAVDERRHFAVGVERQVLGLLEVAHLLLGDVDLEPEVLDRGVDAATVVRVVDAVELHGGQWATGVIAWEATPSPGAALREVRA
jgi:hypothetical protein